MGSLSLELTGVARVVFFIARGIWRSKMKVERKFSPLHPAVFLSHGKVLLPFRWVHLGIIESVEIEIGGAALSQP